MNEESNESNQESETQSLQATGGPETLGPIDDIRRGFSFEGKWWGFHLHFDHACVQAMITAGGNYIVGLISDIIGESLPPPLGEVVSLTVQIRWEIMKLIDKDTNNGVKLSSPWIAPGMLIPTRRGIPSDRLWWLVYGNPQTSFVFSEGGAAHIFADPGETVLVDAAGMAWGGHEQFPGNRSEAGAALASYRGALYCVHCGAPDDYLWYSTFDGDKSWNEGTRFPNNPKSNNNPAVAVYKDRIYCVFRGTDNQLYQSVFDGSSWGLHSQIGSSAGNGPALAVYRDRLHCVFRGTDSQLYHNSFDGSRWGGHSQIGSSAGNGPAIAVYNDSLHCVFRGKGDSRLYHKILTGSSWSGHMQLAPSTDGQPGLVVYHDKHTSTAQLVCVIRGA